MSKVVKVRAPARGCRIAFSHGAVFSLGPFEEADIDVSLASTYCAQGCIVLESTYVAPVAEDVMTPEARAEILGVAIAAMLEKADPAEFTDQGAPRAKAVAVRTGFPVKAEEFLPVFEALIDAQTGQ